MTVIEISGGGLFGVYSDESKDEVVLLDWDDYRADRENYTPCPVRSSGIQDMPEDTRTLLERY